uniref:AAA family ATPase n=1 Tax=Xanthomonas campestris pv. translucens TaxID=343 RepID=UPI00071E9831
MSLELTLLRLSKDRQRFFRLVPSVPREGLEETTLLVVRGLRKFYSEFPKVETLDMDAFIGWMRNVHYAHLPKERLDVLLIALTNMRKDVPAEMEAGMTERLLSVEFASAANGLVQSFVGGGEVDIVRDMQGLAEQFDVRMQRQTRLPLVEESPEDLVVADMDDSGLKFRLSCLSENMRGLRGGDFGILGMRPDAGKTTLLCSESTYWLPQLDILWPGEERCGIWLNNEGPGGRIKKRWYQALLGMSSVDIANLVERGRDEGRPLFTEAIAAKMGMPISRMKFYDIHDMDSNEVERIIRASRPGFVIFDMIDNIRFSGMTANKGERTDQVLEAQYQAARNWCVKYDCAGVATSQLSVDAEGLRSPGQHMLKDSKTGKQGACDFIITGGKDNDASLAGSRWINTPKNKLVRPGRKAPHA